MGTGYALPMSEQTDDGREDLEGYQVFSTVRGVDLTAETSQTRPKDFKCDGY